MNIFIDTGAFYALADASDAHHAAARAFYVTAFREHRFFTTNFVLVETWLLLRNKLGYHAAQTFFATIQKEIIVLLEIASVDLERAALIMDRYADQEFSIVDATSFAAMERARLTAAFAFDGHFRAFRLDDKKEILVLP